MDKDLAIRIAQETIKTNKMSDLLSGANDIFYKNNGKGVAPFAQVDVIFATFMDYVRENTTQRERNLLIVSEFLTKVHHVLHISVQILNEKVNEVESKNIKVLMQALNELELTHLITEGLNKKTIKVLDNIVNVNVKEKPKQKMK